MAAFIRGVDTAAAPNGTYLVVGGQGPLYAVCVNAQGAAISGAMLINATAGGYAAFPRAVYSPDVNGGLGGFMVVWAEAVGNPDAMRQLFARVVTCSGAMTAPQVVWTQVWWEPGDVALAYSSTSKDFLVAWQTPEHTVKATLINLAGTRIDAPVLLSPGMGRDPSVTWNSTTNEFGVAFSGETYSGLCRRPGLELGRLSTQHLQRRRGQADGDDRHCVQPRVGALRDGLVRNFVGELCEGCRIRRVGRAHEPQGSRPPAWAHTTHFQWP